MNLIYEADLKQVDLFIKYIKDDLSTRFITAYSLFTYLDHVDINNLVSDIISYTYI